MSLTELNEASDIKHEMLSVELLYFFRARNAAVGIDFDTEFLGGLRDYSVMALSNSSNVRYNILIVEKAIETMANKMANMIDGASTEDDKRKIYPSIIRMEEILGQLKSELSELEDKYAK